MRIPAAVSVALLAGLTILAGCTSTPKPRPRPAPRPVPVPSYVPPAPKPLANDWRDWPYTPGDWSYARDARGSIASFGTPVIFTLRCDLAANVVVMSRAVGSAAPSAAPAVAATLTIRTSSALRTLAAQPAGGWLAVSLAPRDGLLEAMGFSRGRFVVEQSGLPALVLPSWAEIGRVTEDCRR